MTTAGLLAAALSVCAAFAGTERKYPETVSLLRQAYARELSGHLEYLAYARQARSDGYRNLSYLFAALGKAEAVHERAFRRLLAELGAEPAAEAAPAVEVQGTKSNLKEALEGEIDDIDRGYPSLLARAREEGHAAAIENLSRAWRSENAHRDQLSRASRYSGSLFGVLTELIERARLRFFVCDLCGFVAAQAPKASCPVCGGPLSGFHEVARQER